MLDLSIMNSCLRYRATIADCSIPLAKFKLDVARALIMMQEPDDEYVSPVYDAKIRFARHVNHSARYDLVNHFPRKLQNLKHSH